MKESDMRMEKHERLRRCKEGGDHENSELLLNWVTLQRAICWSHVSPIEAEITAVKSGESGAEENAGKRLAENKLGSEPENNGNGGR
ncbi:hypothetical protein SESBI_33480 [Sesbania bispinosa]|nr:hypothetical protein SESBI_33480 [Sesbania bispinosa]